MSLPLITIADQLNWLPRTPYAAAAVAPGLPPGYEVYLQLLPPLGIDRSIPIAEYSFATKTVAELNVRVAFWNKYRIVLDQPSPDKLEAITYREVAASLGLKYDAQISNAAIARAYGSWPPHLGSSPTLEAVFVQQLLQATGLTTECYFYGSDEEGNGHWKTDDFSADWLKHGLSADLPEVCRWSGRPPTYFFAADHSWCFYQGEETHMVVGCDKPLAQALLAQQKLEILPLSAL